ncbi:MAG: PAS domain S-box protein, partial [Caulobacteraceae bacterium]
MTFFNRAAAELAGRQPVVGEDRWCVTHKLYRPSGEPMAHDACPMAVALKEDRAVRGARIVAERPDGSRAPVMPFPTPIRDTSGKLVGGVNLLVDISELRAAQDALARRAEQQAALYRFTDRLYRARYLATAYEAALDAIDEAMGCERASILMADEGGTMRFVAWRGLSETYRRAVEGHSPWRPAELDPQPIWIADVGETDESEAVKAALMAEGIVGLAFIPLVASGALVDKFMVYHREPHAFSIGERELGLTIARQLGFSIEQKRQAEARRSVEAALRQSEGLFRAIVDTTPECVTLVAPGGELLFINRSGLAMVGATRDDELVGGLVLRIVAPEDRETFSRFVDRVCGGAGGEVSYDIEGLDGRRRRMETRAEPFAGADGRAAMLAV